MSRMTATFVSIVAVVLIMFVFVYTALMNKQARETWATTQGVVVESRVEARNEAGADRPNVRYGARIAYEYVVNGKTYRSERVSYEGTLWRPTREAAEADRARFAEGQKVSVFYDPEKPERAVLDVPEVEGKR